MAITDEISIDNMFSAKDRGENGAQLARPYTFIVKPYQRGYRWEAIHINHLIEDLLNFEETKPENNR